MGWCNWTGGCNQTPVIKPVNIVQSAKYPYHSIDNNNHSKYSDFSLALCNHLLFNWMLQLVQPKIVILGYSNI